MAKLEVGILAFQGAFMEHEEAVQQAFWSARDSGCFQGLELCLRQVRKAEDIEGLHGLILPGGESTTMAKFLQRNDFYDAINHWRNGRVHFMMYTLHSW